MDKCFQETSLELVVVGEDGIVQSICEQSIFGVIKDLAILRWNEKFRQAMPQVCCNLCSITLILLTSIFLLRY